MTPAEFKRKWARYSGKETAAYQEHFNDLCALLGQPTPAAADPTGNESFCFQKRGIKDAELFALEASDRVAEEPPAERERGFADVWKRGCFAWEYKGKKENLDAAYQQLLRYRESLLNPPLLVVCDFDRYVIRTNFNGTVQETHEFTNANIDDPKIVPLLRAVFTDPEFLKPQRTTDEVTEKLAQQIGEVARLLQKRESVELIDARSRRELAVAQRKNLRIARFLNRIVFCFFAEDTGLLPKNVVTEIFKTGVDDPTHFAEVLEDLFRKMAKGGTFGPHKIRNFNGHLFEEATVFELTEEEIGKLAVAGEADWQFIQPSIMGNLFERGLDPVDKAAGYQGPFAKLEGGAKSFRAHNKRDVYRQKWWIHAEPRPELRKAVKSLSRFLVTLSTSKHRLFAWVQQPTLPDQQVYVFARDDDYFFGVLHSRFHEVWALKLGTRLETRESGFRYTPTTCFETFPFPEAGEQQNKEIAAAAKELNELRENWLNPPEWTATRVLEFPGATDGPWSRFVADPDERRIGTVRYPRVEPRDDDCAKKLAKRTLTNLYNELPAWLTHAHAKLDSAVAAAYGFNVDLTNEQILERLLALNV